MARVGLVAATALGIGGMMGAAPYTMLGLAAPATGSYLPVAFAVAALAAAFPAYSYARLGSTFPSRGGAARFIVEEYGPGLASGGLNVFQFLAYLIAASLYAAGFAAYAQALVGDALPSWTAGAFGVGVVLVFLVVNLFGSRLVGRAETVIVAVEVVILVGFVVLGLSHADPSRLTDGGGRGFLGIVTGAAVLYVSYQGFGVVANASDRMARPGREVPRAMFLALGIVTVLYVTISALAVSLLPMPTIVADNGHVLADAGQVVAGRIGFVVIAVAALLATASAVNATLFAASNIGYFEARHGELSSALARTVGRSGSVALVLSAAVVALLVLLFPLSAVGQMTSLAFLVLYAGVSAGHLRIRARTGAHAWPLIAAVVINVVLFVALLADAIGSGSVGTWATLLAALVGSFAVEAVYIARSDGRGGRRGQVASSTADDAGP